MSRVRSPSPAPSDLAQSYALIRDYLPAALLAADAAARNWIRPTPKPPTAPASSPSTTSTGMVSRSAFLPNFAIFSVLLGSGFPYQFSICASNSSLGRLRKGLRYRGIAGKAPLATAMVQSFAPSRESVRGGQCAATNRENVPRRKPPPAL
jgi:hypothetical protein